MLLRSAPGDGYVPKIEVKMAVSEHTIPVSKRGAPYGGSSNACLSRTGAEPFVCQKP